MREILFRGKRQSNGKWVEGFCLKHTTTTQVGKRLENFIYEPYSDTEYNVIPETVGQYTGLTDSNAVKIFEGDIVKLSGYSSPGKIEWSCGLSGFSLEIYGEHIPLAGYLCKHLDVIGNIYDNPELLGTATGEDAGNATQGALLPAT